MSQDDFLMAEAFYHDVDTFLRIVGPEKVGSTDVFFRLSRVAIGAKVDYSLMRRVIPKITSLSAWYEAWKESAEHFRSLAEEANRDGNNTTAGEHYLRAAHLYHFAQLFTRPEDPRRDEGQRLRVDLYRKACPHLVPPVEIIKVAYGDLEIPGYLRSPVAGGSRGWVLMLPGANSVKEELHNWGEHFNKRGLTTLAIDGPGQGELSVRNGGAPLRFADYHNAVSAVIDHMEALQLSEADRVVVWGQSTGGQLAIRAAAHDSRIAAVVSLGGGYDFRLETAVTTPVDVREEARDLHGFKSFDETEEYVRIHGSLTGIVEQVQCPILLIHGVEDNIVSLEEMQLIRDESGGRSELWTYPDGNHSVCNRNLEMSPRMADWVVRAISGG